MPDYQEGIKKEVAEIKFLIHDLRVERFINEVIHFHVTLNTDLEIYGIEQAQYLHGTDLQVLKETAVELRKALREYANAVKSFSPDKTIILLGKRYIDTIYSMCELILNPLWGRIDKVISFLPADAKSVQARTHYRNCINWIQGVRLRIDNFWQEQRADSVYREFDISAALERFTFNVVNGYVREKSRNTVEIELDRLDSAMLGGNLPRFLRMYFNLVMNAVDAMSGRAVGLLNVSVTRQNDRVVLKVRDNGSGMPPEKIRDLLTDKETLDGELHSLGFVFVRQTIDAFNGTLSIDSEVDKGTTVTIEFPLLDSSQAHPEPQTTEQPAVKQPATEQPAVKQPAVKQPAMEQPAVKQPATEQPAVKQPATEQPAVKQPATEQPAVKQPAPGPATGQGAPRPSPTRAESTSDTALASSEPADDEADRERHCGRMVYRAYEASQAEFPGSIFAISLDFGGNFELFTHRPYERYYDVTHEDLTPMFYEAVMRGRIDEDEQKQPALTLKAPQSVAEYFEFKEVPEPQRDHATYLRMVRDDYIRVARKLIETGMPSNLNVLVDRLERFFPESPALAEAEPFALELLAAQPLADEVTLRADERSA